MKNNLVIAIDGPAAAGKSTTAKRLAQIMSYTYIDTGAMYRAVALAAHLKKIELNNTTLLEQLLNEMTISFKIINGTQAVFLNGSNVSQRIREPDITKMSSEIAIIPCVRERLVSLQQEMGKDGAVIMDGRDIGTVVFPNADFKFFLIADIKTRALRRWKELKDRTIKLEDVEKEIFWRDNNDRNRETSPLIKAEDAAEIDTSGMSVDEQVSYVYQQIINSL